MADALSRAVDVLLVVGIFAGKGLIALVVLQPLFA